MKDKKPERKTKSFALGRAHRYGLWSKIKNRSFTLIEILVAVGIFSVAISVASGLFVSAIQLQRKSLARQELLDQTSYAMEYMSRALRMAKKDLGPVCLSESGLNYESSNFRVVQGVPYWGTGIKFINSRDECQEIFLDVATWQLKDTKNGSAPVPLTSSALAVNSFSIPSGGPVRGWSQTDTLQPRVTFYLDINGREGTNIKIQTTVSQRKLDVQY